ncbi:Putative pyridoxal phosphate-dependent enzyme [Ignavibacterium album JCM 16511]|uniref:Putative pyridoxal phosphate-dependent enzyme n=1 Tax=Ignavibacterium album (strain DSM 19864 / JCM 16511 / NBRC 101810 / Mat9-16) TaxID=945713 RepID=I0ANM7_IGNAJ|nr:DegT/DnrJ/EryC1/StrS family aminotransferase [Ignavibacterium album]AFH50584.1 Putative pyridoxal phosphate-dependent enzyme [Ignavibacterium album JCM 16511]
MIYYENLFDANSKFFREFREKFEQVINSGWFILGNEVKNFENEFASYHNVKNCIGVASGLDALTLSLSASSIPENSEVIVPSNTYIATILSILHAKLKPVLVEPDIRTYNINPAKIEEKISASTKAIMVVHLYGKSCDMDPIAELCKKYNLILIEDCAQSHGAKYKGKLTGTFGDFGAFSFYPTKNLGALGDAGAVITNNDIYSDRLRKLRNYGSSKKYYNELIGYNSRLDEIQAALLSIKLKYLDQINTHKRKLAKIYSDNLKDDFIKPAIDDNYFDVYHIYNIRHPKRDKLKEYLLKHEIMTEIHYPVPPHKQKALEGILSGEYPIAEEIHNTTLSLPCSFGHSYDDIYRVVEVINKF